jgi:hypothetical protein
MSFEDDILQALLTAEENEAVFPFEPGQVITAPLVVQRVQKMWPPDPEATWQAQLVPIGEKVNGLIVTNVELADVVPTRRRWHTGGNSAPP